MSDTNGSEGANGSAAPGGSDGSEGLAAPVLFGDTSIFSGLSIATGGVIPDGTSISSGVGTGGTIPSGDETGSASYMGNDSSTLSSTPANSQLPIIIIYAPPANAVNFYEGLQGTAPIAGVPEPTATVVDQIPSINQMYLDPVGGVQASPEPLNYIPTNSQQSIDAAPLQNVNLSPAQSELPPVTVNIGAELSLGVVGAMLQTSPELDSTTTTLFAGGGFGVYGSWYLQHGGVADLRDMLGYYLNLSNLPPPDEVGVYFGLFGPEISLGVDIPDDTLVLGLYLGAQEVDLNLGLSGYSPAFPEEIDPWGVLPPVQ